MNETESVSLLPHDELFSVNGKRVIVSGASQGIGRAITLGFAERGARVFAVARSESGLAETARMAQGFAGSVTRHAVDLRAPDSPKETIAAAVQAFGGIDVLVNNAGHDVEKVIEETSPDEWDDVLDLNVRSVFLMCKEAAPYLKDGGGKVVNIASVLGHIAMRQDIAYVTSKHAVVGFTRALALDWARQGVQVNAIGPGYVETRMLARAVADEASARYMRRDTPQGRWANPEEMVGTAIFLSSAASDFMTGQLVLVDGGKTAK